MVLVSALIGLIAGILLTILSEASKKATLKRYATSKLYAEITLMSKEIVEANLLPFAQLSDLIYEKDSYLDISESSKKLDEYIKAIKIELLKNPEKLFIDFSALKKNLLNLEKHIAFFELYEVKFKNSDLLLNKSEIACLSTVYQPRIIELADNYFHCAYNLKYFLIRIKTEEIDIEKSLDDLLEAFRYLTKAYKDRKQILNYSKKISEKNFIQLLFD
jgi:hypothetical protein